MPKLKGALVDNESRCIHWAGATDVVAMRFSCCDTYYPCFECHALESHDSLVWPRARFDELAVLCGVCRHELTVNEYLAVGACPSCGAGFNPGCALHHHLYFETELHA